jgi:hypothetical protein
MLILRPGRVAAALRAGSLSEDDKVRLVLAWTAIQSVLGTRSVVGARSWTDVVLTLLYIVASMAGIVRCYRVNQAGDGRSFVERFICIGVPISIWLGTASFLASYAAATLMRARFGNTTSPPMLALFAYLVVLPFGSLAIYFAILERLLERVASASA